MFVIINPEIEDENDKKYKIPLMAQPGLWIYKIIFLH